VVPCGRTTLVALADGLGHGPEAARAALAFCGHARDAAAAPLDEILASADRAVAGTRGVAAALLRIDPPGHLEFAGVGNVAVRVLGRTPVHPLNVAGTVGRRSSRRARTERFPIAAGDLVVMHTDGVATHWDLDPLDRVAAPSRVAEALLRAHGRTHDDATCLVIRWDGSAREEGAGGSGEASP
jgi:hypothetical protein